MRSPDEWEDGHIPGAMHIFLPELREKRGASSTKTKPTAVYCDSGYRASIATSMLKQEGFQLRLQRARKLAGVEEGEVSRSKEERRRK